MDRKKILEDKKLTMYEERFYRKDFAKDWFSYELTVEETDILVRSKNPLDRRFIYNSIKRYRQDIQDYINRFPEFKSSLSAFSLREPAPLIVKDMIEKTSFLDIGPMSAVAGAIAEYLGKALLKFSDELIVENGGDVFIKKKGEINLGLYAGEGNFINDLVLGLKNTSLYLGICSSSSFLGHSLSLGSADLVTVVSDSVVFSDALATKLANMVCKEDDVNSVIDYALTLVYKPQGILIVKREKIGF
ncbi:MAG TPA: UPF0280 family protein, partial [Candidatus Omnitrophica bacterium]|nr:UPF0280 family protein [Candidatus Omnitrophota bacterium]